MHSALLSILVAFAGYSLLNLSQASQKIGLARFKTHKLSGAVLWATATVCTSLSVFVLLYAVSLGSVSVVGAMAGTGLSSLAVFSAVVMKERISRLEIAGVAVILGAAVLIGLFSWEAPEGEASAPRVRALFIYSGAAVVVFSAAWVLLARKQGGGLVIGGFAGALGGLVPLFQKLSTSTVGRAASWKANADPLQDSGFVQRVMEILLNPHALLWVVLSIFSMVVLQFSYRKDRAIRIVPVFSAVYIVIPVLGGQIGFHEQLQGPQWAGVALILVGVMLLTGRVRRGRSTSL